MIDSVYQKFGNKLRLRVCGLCLEDDRLLMINHRGIRNGDFWAPPGGGLNFGESLETCLKREFNEETGLSVEIQNFQFISEFINMPLHAIEIFFLVKITHGIVKMGIDPEMKDNQIIQEVKFMSWKEITGLDPKSRHGIFNIIPESSKILDLKGHFKL
jgi:8-oxo-dGTP diphosphatase